VNEKTVEVLAGAKAGRRASAGDDKTFQFLEG